MLGDVNGDGRPDIVLISGDKVSVLLGKGHGTFAAPVDSATGVGPRALALGDLDGDGKLDMVTANYAPEAEYGTVTSLLGNGDGTFTTKVEYEAEGENTRTVALADLDSDGKLDLVVVDQGARTRLELGAEREARPRGRQLPGEGLERLGVGSEFGRAGRCER